MTAPAIVLDEATHTYLVDGKPMLSVSDVMRLGGIDTDYARVPPAVLTWARERGSHVDLCCELLDQDVLDWDSVAEEAKPYVEAWAQFKTDTGFVPRLQQPMIYHPVLGYCGSPDVRGDWPYMDGSVFHDVVVDKKCTYDVSRSYGVQVGAYAREGIVYPGEGPLEQALYRAVVQLQKTGKYKLFSDLPGDTAGKKILDPSDFDAFKAALVIARWKMRC